MSTNFALKDHIYEETTFGAVVFVIDSLDHAFGPWFFRNCLILVQGDTSMPAGSIRELSIHEPLWKRLT